MKTAENIFRLGIKELWSLARDPIMMILIVISFTVVIFGGVTAVSEVLNNTPIAIVDEDSSPLSARIISAFYPPRFQYARVIPLTEVDPSMNSGKYTFALDIPPDFQRDVLNGRSPAIQLNVDATCMIQAFIGSGQVRQIVMEEVNEFVQRYRSNVSLPVDLAFRVRFNPNLERPWFGALRELIDQITILAILLAGAALIREREHGTIEHLLVMPVTPLEIMVAKIWSMSLVVLVAATLSLVFVVQGALHIPIQGSIVLFIFLAALHLFAATSMGIFMATVARSMPQFGLLMVLVLLPLQMLSGGITPRESMPDLVQNIMLVAPTTHFVSGSQAILYRAAGLEVVWRQMLALAAIGSVFFTVALIRFRKTIGQMA
jgi:ABC-2 type transport system permease protein